MNAVYDLLEDTENLSGTSTAGERAMLRMLQPKAVADFLDEFRSHLLTSVEHGTWKRFLPGSVVGTKVPQKSGESFLASLRSRVFDARTGRVLTFPDPTAFKILYQVASIYDKFGSGNVTQKMIDAAVTTYKSDEQTIRELNLSGSVELLELARDLISRYFLRYLSWDGVTGRHGPGAVSEGRMPFWVKYTSLRPHEDLDVYWPDIRLYNPCKQDFVDDEATSARTSRMCFVPKNRRKCRVICAEPCLLQYLQQGLRLPLYRAIEVSPIGIDLHDQTVNASVALEASSHGYYATLDLRAASDLLSLALVGALFPTPVFAKMAACRSTHTLIPSAEHPENLELSKFGSMGNALTFPVQTLCFWGLIAAARMLSGEREREAVSDVWVYGDDIICPRHSVTAALWALSSAGLEVNLEKSFWRGDFRESCGIHAYRGIDVTPAYLRTWSHDPESLVSMCATARLLDSQGFFKTARGIYDALEQRLGMRLPASRRAEGLARWTFEETDRAIALENESRGIPVKQKQYGRLAVQTFGLRPLVKRDKKTKEVKRRYVAFSSNWDMWDYKGPHASSSDRDRGIVASGVRFTRMWMPLSE